LLPKFVPIYLERGRALYLERPIVESALAPFLTCKFTLLECLLPKFVPIFLERGRALQIECDRS